jgi:hypothetical protein
MQNLTDTAQIAIIITVFSALMLMITCILYKMSKLKEVMDRQPGIPASVDLVSDFNCVNTPRILTLLHL